MLVSATYGLDPGATSSSVFCMTMVYTVNQLARLAGASMQMLHYYDLIGLLKPTRW